MSPTSVVGHCASQLQYRVGGTAQFTLRLTQTGAALTGTIEPGRGTCDVTGSVARNALTLATTTCRPHDRTIEFFVCGDESSEFVIRSFAMETSVNGAMLTGKYIYADDIRTPVQGPAVGVLTENGDVTMTRQ